MALVIAIDVLVVLMLVVRAFHKGFESILPLAAGLMLVFPNESQIALPGLFDLTTQRLIVITLIVLYVLLARGSDSRPSLPLKYLIILQILWMFISAVNSVVFTVSFKTVLSQLFDFFVPYYIFTRAVSRIETVHKVLTALVVAVVICSVFGAIEAYGEWSILSLFPVGGHRLGGEIVGAVSDRGGRVQSTFGHPILFGGGLALAIPLALYLVSTAKTASRKAFLWASIMLMFLNIYKTGSRGPWIAVVLSIALMLLMGPMQMRRYVGRIVLLTLAVLIIRPGVWESIKNVYYETKDPESAAGQSYEWRYALYRVANQQVTKDFGRALWGYGPESFFYLQIAAEFQGRMVLFDSCDSSIAELLIETGYLGLLIALGLFATSAVLALRNFRKLSEPANSLCLVFFINITAFCFLMTNVAIYGWGQQSYMVWILIALSMIYPQLQSLKTPATTVVSADGVTSEELSYA